MRRPGRSHARKKTAREVVGVEKRRRNLCGMTPGLSTIPISAASAIESRRGLINELQDDGFPGDSDMPAVEAGTDHEITFYSHPEHQQDRWVIQDVLKGLRGGYFVEAGASEIGENTYALEAQFGWTGLLMEPHPGQFEIVRAKRHCIVDNVCLADVETEVEFVINHDRPGTSAIRESISDVQKKLFYSGGEATETIRIKAYPLADLLRRHGAPKRIDYLSLDVEGAEWLVLKDFPFDEYAFSCMTIERGSDDYLRLRAKLLGEGYRLVRIGSSDDFWVHPSVSYRAPFRDVLNTSIRRVAQRIKALWRSGPRPS
jgi:FkbM family methyltransferase